MKNLKSEIKGALVSLLRKAELLKNENIIETLETPPDTEMGDMATSISFSLASKLGKPPTQISEEIIADLTLSKNSFISKIETKGGYINFFLNYQKLSEKLLKKILEQGEIYGSSDYVGNQEVLIEYSAPNPNKPMHIGHTRNNFIGMSINNILSFNGYKTHPVNEINDRGIHICKSLWGYLQFGKKTGSEGIKNWRKLLEEWYEDQSKWTIPKDVGKKPDHFVMDYYVKAANMIAEDKEYDRQNREVLQEWEKGNKKVRDLWKKMNNWAYQGWDETYKRQGCEFEKYYYESNLYKRGKEIVLENIDGNLFFKSDKGTVVANLERYNLPGLVFIRSDGTTLYQTNDLALTEKKVQDYPNSKLIWVVGGEHKLYFKQLFQVFDNLGIVKKDECYHLGYGLISLPEGKMSSRKGKVILADDLMDEVHEMVKKEVEERNPELNENEKRDISEKIALGALKYGMLRIDAFKNIVFDPKEIIKFEGNTGPYLQYAHVRANKILKKVNGFKNRYQPEKLEKEEKLLIGKLLGFPEVVEKAAKEYKPNLVANYGYELAEAFNSFYHSCPVIQSEDETKEFRLTLVKAFKITLKNCLTLLGIDTPEIM
ncbi:MAG: arginine--tRNA ligase [Candidatus Aenigmarchaeota archaeon]|nr:arginine--tRNA ligase [Candidatus Aenigmarchaeota archaeon]